MKELHKNNKNIAIFNSFMTEVPIIKKPVSANEWTDFCDRDLHHVRVKP